MMDDIFELIIDFFLELFVWERLNEHLGKYISSKPLRWILATLIYVCIFALLLAILLGLYLLIT